MKLVNPRIGLIGPSTVEQNQYGVSDGSVRSGNAASGPFTWAMMEHRCGQMLLAGSVTAPYFAGDNRGAGGAQFEDYPAQIAGLAARFAAVPVGQRVVMYDPGRNPIQDGMSAATYKTNVLRDVADIRARGAAYIFLSQLWKKPVAYGGVWADGGAARATVDEINAWMPTLVASDLKLVPFPAYLTDPGSPVGDPYPNVTRGIDYTHLTNLGGRLGGKAVSAALAPYIELNAYPAAPAENLVPAFSGSGGALTGTGASGVVVDGWSTAYSGAVGTVAGSTETIGGALYQRYAVAATASLPANGANIIMQRTVTVPAGKKTGLRVKVKIPASLVPYGLFFVFGTAADQGLSPNQRAALIAGIANITANTAVSGAGVNFAGSVKFDGSADLDLWLETSTYVLTSSSALPIGVYLNTIVGPAASNASQFMIKLGEVQTFDWPI